MKWFICIVVSPTYFFIEGAWLENWVIYPIRYPIYYIIHYQKKEGTKKNE